MRDSSHIIADFPSICATWGSKLGSDYRWVPSNAPYCTPKLAGLTGSIASNSTSVTFKGSDPGIVTNGTMTLGFYLNGANHPKIIGGSWPTYKLNQPPAIDGSPKAFANAIIEVDRIVDLEGYFFNDAIPTFADNNAVVIFKNNSVRLGKLWCRFASVGATYWGEADLTAWNNYIGTTDACAADAYLFGTTADPGLKQQGTFTAGVIRGAITFSAMSGRLPIHAYIKYAGQTGMYFIKFSGYDFECTTLAQCQGERAALYFKSGDGADNVASSLNIPAGTAFTVGPATQNVGAAFTGANTFDLRYNVMENYGNLRTGSGTGNEVAIANVWFSKSGFGSHIDGIAQQPANYEGVVCKGGRDCDVTIKNTELEFNTIVNTSSVVNGTITAVKAYFTSSGIANVYPPKGYTVTRETVSSNNNTIVVNRTKLVNTNTDVAANAYSNPGRFMMNLVGQGPPSQNIGPGYFVGDGNGRSGTLHIVSAGKMVGAFVVGTHVHCNSNNFHPNCHLVTITGPAAPLGTDQVAWKVDADFNDGDVTHYDGVFDSPYPGIVGTWNIHDNFMDTTGLGASAICFIPDVYTTIWGTKISISGNKNMITGSTIGSDNVNCR